MTRDTWLKILLRLFGTSSLFALVAVFMPTRWMASVHGSLGLGAFPESPLTEYLTRSLSLFYFLIGLLLWALSNDLERYRPLVRWVGWASLVGGGFLLGIDLYARLPVWWTWHEGPTAAAFGALLVWLAGER